MADTPALAPLRRLAGDWKGASKLWMRPDQPAHDSESRLTVIPILHGTFVRFNYRWDEDGPQEGQILFGHEADPGVLTAVWVDTWHMGTKAMLLRGVEGESPLAVHGTYGDPPGPAWGWWITVEPKSTEGFRLLMHNVPPEMDRVPAVETVYRRSPTEP